MLREVTMTRMDARDLATRLDETLDRVATTHVRIVLERAGRPPVAIVPVEDLDQLEDHELPEPIRPLRPLTEEFIDEAIERGRR